MQTADQTQTTISRNYKFTRYFITLLLTVSLGANIFFIGKNINSTQTDFVVEEEISQPIYQQQSEPKSFAKEYDFLLKEYQLLTKSNKYAESKLFGFKFNQFHQDWECKPKDMVFTNDGVTVTCHQKPCSLSTQNQDDEALPVDRKMANDCFAELENREFPNSILSSFDIKVSPVYLESGQTLADAVGFTPNKTTLDGLFYQFNENTSSDNRETGWSKKYEVTFYSPKTLSDKLSQYGGTYFGSEEIYAKYQVDVGFYETEDEDRMNIETQFNSLISRLIDSITFIEKQI